MNILNIDNKRSFIIFAYLLVCMSGLGQYFRTGSESSSIKWKQIKTNHLQVIFPEQNEALAQVFVSKFEYALDFFRPQLKKDPRKLSVVLHNFSPQSNGLVSFAPSRMELWTRPPQDMEAQDWLESLIIHEYRHFVQVSNLDQGFTTMLKWLFGEQGQLIPLGLHIPRWYLEGDAVVSETVYSNAGRGRIPSFDQEFKALLLEKGIPSYEELMLPSYKYFRPDNYQTGYHLVGAHLLYNSDSVFIKKLDRIARHPLHLVPFSNKARGLRDRGRKKFYREAMVILDSIWSSQHAAKPIVPETFVSDSPKFYNNLTHLKLDGDKLYALNHSFSILPSLVEVGHESSVFIKELGLYADNEIDVRINHLAWVENNGHVLWDQKGSSDLWLMNLDTGKKKRLTKGKYYASPAINPQNKVIAVVEYFTDYRFQLAMVDSETGQVLQRIDNPENDNILHPTWSNDGSMLVFITLNKNGKGLSVWSEKEGVRVVLENRFEEIINPVLVDSNLYFSAGFDGTLQIYALALGSGSLAKLTEAPFGANFPAVDTANNKLYYCSYHSNGYRIAEQSLDVGHTVNYKQLSETVDRFAEKLSAQQGEVIDFENRPQKKYKVNNYSKFFHAINLHSWFPARVDLENQDLYAGITLLSQDVLGNNVLELGYNANPSFKDEMFTADYTNYGLWPNLKLSYSYGYDGVNYDFQKDVYNARGNVIGYVDTIINVGSIYNSMSVTLSFPMDFSRLNYYAGIRPEMAMSYQTTNVSFDVGNGSQSYSDNYVPLIFWTSFYWVKQMARRDLEYPLGVKGSFAFKTTDYGLVGNNQDLFFSNLGTVYGYDITAFLGGLAPHHALLIRNVYQKKIAGDPIFNDQDELIGYDYMHNLYSMPRGYYDAQNTEMMRLSIDYRMPIAYPEWSIGWLAYIKRISAGLFADYGSLTDKYNQHLLTSTYGGLLFIDANFLRYEPEIMLGVQGGYNTNLNQTFYNLILSIDMPW